MTTMPDHLPAPIDEWWLQVGEWVYAAWERAYAEDLAPRFSRRSEVSPIRTSRRREVSSSRWKRKCDGPR